jgi:hypothetical protein
MSVQPQQQINIELGEKEAEGVYANLAMIVHSPTEIIIDFARVMPRSPKARVQARIIMTPMHAKLLHKALGENLKRFEEQFGEIKMHGGPHQVTKPIGFETNTDSTGAPGTKTPPNPLRSAFLVDSGPTANHRLAMSVAKTLDKCPFCREPIMPGAVRCKHCHADLKTVVSKRSPLAGLNTFRTGFLGGIVFCLILAVLGYLQFYTGD